MADSGVASVHQEAHEGLHPVFFAGLIDFNVWGLFTTPVHKTDQAFGKFALLLHFLPDLMRAAGKTFKIQICHPGSSRYCCQRKRKSLSDLFESDAMQVWTPLNNKKFETLSYLPPLSADAISKEISYMISKGWTPCIEFDEVGYVSRDNFQGCGYYDGRYWTMWKLPLFGCTDPSQVLKEVAEAKSAYPKAFIRVLGFDAKRQVQCSGFLVQRPGQANF